MVKNELKKFSLMLPRFLARGTLKELFLGTVGIAQRWQCVKESTISRNVYCNHCSPKWSNIQTVSLRDYKGILVFTFLAQITLISRELCGNQTLSSLFVISFKSCWYVII